MNSRLPGLLLWSLAGVLALAALPGRAQSPDSAASRTTAPASPGGAAAPADPQNLPELTSWTIPAIRWGGNTGSTYVYNTDMMGASSLTDTQLLSGRAASFIYAPWFAQVNANAVLSTTAGKYESGSTNSKSDSTTLSYGGNVNVFPVSRFPFTAYFESSDSRAKAMTSGSADVASTTQYSSLRLGARQSYRPETGNDSMNASADHSRVTSGAMRSVVNAFQGSYSTNIEDHSLAATARFSSTSGDVGGQGSTLFGANANHTWQIPEEGLTISNFASFSQNQLKTLSINGGGLALNNSRVLQATSSFSWIPDEELPLTITGGGGLLNTATDTEVDRTTLTNLNAYVNASYRINNNLTASGAASVANTSTTSAGTGLLLANTPGGQNPSRLTTTTQSASISYSGDPLSFGNYSYTWGGGANLHNQTASLGGANRVLSGSAQHSLNRSFSLSETSLLALNANQSVSLNATSTGTANNQNTTLTHGVGAVWRATLGPVSTATLSVNASDSLSSGNFSNHLRSFTGTGNFQRQLSSRASVSAAANVSASQQLSSPLTYTTTTTGLGTTNTTQPTTVWNGSGQVSYSHRNPFDVSNLVYTASFTTTANQSNLRLVTGDPNALAWQVARVFTNQATYRVGRLQFQLTGSMAWLGDGKKNATLFGSISREIGDF